MTNSEMNFDYIVDRFLIEDNGKKKSCSCAIAEIRKRANMSKKEFADYLKIPYRTIQDWELGKFEPPEYVLRMIVYRMEIEKMKKEKNP